MAIPKVGPKLPVYRGLPAGSPGVPPRPVAAGPPPPRRYRTDTPDVVVRTHTIRWTGYGMHAQWVGRGLERLGLSCGYLDLQDLDHGQQDRFTEYRQVREFHARRCRLQLATPGVTPLDGTDAAFTMWESSRLDPSAVANLNLASAVIVPCRWNETVFAESGVTRPVVRVPLGYDPGLFFPRPYRDGPFTVGLAGRRAHGGVRKGLDEGIEAFRLAFPREKDVRLVLKVFPDCLPRVALPDDRRIVPTAEVLDGPAVAAWYAGLDVLLVPTKAEGFGLHTLEAMACGRAVIAAPETGTADVWTPGCGWPLGGRWEPAEDVYRGLGDWYVPSRDDMVDALRAAYRDRDGCRARGAFARTAAAPLTWWSAGEALYDALAALGTLPARGTSNPTARPAGPSYGTPGAFSDTLKSRARSCVHRETTSPCGCDGYCRLGRGFPVTDPRDGIRRSYVDLDACGRCDDLPGAG